MRDGWAEAARTCHARGEDALLDDRSQSSDKDSEKNNHAMPLHELEGFLNGIDTDVTREEGRI